MKDPEQPLLAGKRTVSPAEYVRTTIKDMKKRVVIMYVIFGILAAVLVVFAILGLVGYIDLKQHTDDDTPHTNAEFYRVFTQWRLQDRHQVVLAIGKEACDPSLDIATVVKNEASGAAYTCPGTADYSSVVDFAKMRAQSAFITEQLEYSPICYAGFDNVAGCAQGLVRACGATAPSQNGAFSSGTPLYDVCESLMSAHGEQGLGAGADANTVANSNLKWCYKAECESISSGKPDYCSNSLANINVYPDKVFNIPCAPYRYSV